MQSVQLFDLASQQARWLSVRQAAVAGNIANANTPGYAAVDVEPFDKVLARSVRSQMVTQAGHIPGVRAGGAEAVEMGEGSKGNGSMSLLPSGNGVVMEDELLKAGEVRRAFEMNTAIVKAFHRMLLTTVRS